jgi:hypothetical protein
VYIIIIFNIFRLGFKLYSRFLPIQRNFIYWKNWGSRLGKCLAEVFNISSGTIRFWIQEVHLISVGIILYLIFPHIPINCQWYTLNMRISNINKHFKFRSFLGLNWYKHRYKVQINAWRDIIYNKMQILLYQEMRYIGPDLPQRSAAVLAFARFRIQQQTTLASFYWLWNSRNMLRNRLSLVLALWCANYTSSWARIL